MSTGTVTLIITGTDADFDQAEQALGAGTPVSDVLFEMHRLVEAHAGECILTVTVAWRGDW